MGTRRGLALLSKEAVNLPDGKIRAILYIRMKIFGSVMRD